METRDVFVYVSADTDFSSGTYGDSIYVAWADSTAATGSNASNNHSRIQVAYSRNGGSNRNITTPHETADANSVDRYHQGLAVDENGRVHIMFYDTRRSAARTAVDVYYSFSDANNPTWVYITSIVPPGGGAQTLTAQYTLPVVTGPKACSTAVAWAPSTPREPLSSGSTSRSTTTTTVPTTTWANTRATTRTRPTTRSWW